VYQLVGGEPLSLDERLPQATLASRGSGFKAPPHISEDDRSYFVGSKGSRRSLSKSSDGRTEWKLSEPRE
jgi:hypothetical protein